MMSRSEHGDKQLESSVPLTTDNDGLVLAFSDHASVCVLRNGEQVRIELSFPSASIHLDIVWGVHRHLQARATTRFSASAALRRCFRKSRKTDRTEWIHSNEDNATVGIDLLVLISSLDGMQN